MNAKESQCDSVSSPAHGTSLHSDPNQGEQGRLIPSVTETSAADGISSAAVSNGEQHCDVKVDVHRKSSSASSEPAVVALDLQSEKISRQSVVKSVVLQI